MASEGLGRRLRVLVGNATRNSGLAVMRDLGRAGFDVIGVDDQLLPFDLHSRYSRPYRLFPNARDPRVREAVLGLLREVGPDVLLPMGTPMVEIVSRDAGLFESLTGVNVPSHDSVVAAMDNTRTMEECRRLGIACPEVYDHEQAVRMLESGGNGAESRRIVVKPREDRGGAQGVSYVSDPRMLDSRIESCRSQYGEVLLQEYIPGDATAMRTVIVMYDRDSRLLAFFTTRKLRQWPVTGGITAMSESTRDLGLLEQVRPFFETWRWRGPAEVELKVDPRDGVTKVIEINPRFCSYIGFPVRCGLPLPRMAALAAAGGWDGDPCPPYAEGVRYINTMAYLKATVTELRQRRDRGTAARQVWAEIRRGAVGNSVDPRDPVPRIGKLLHEVSTAVSSLRYKRSKFYAAPLFVPSWGWGELRATVGCLATGRIVRGGETDRLARDVEKLLGVRYALPVNRGRVAILVALRALGIGEGDDVVLPSYLCASVLEAVRAAGARPVLADVDAGLHLTLESVRKALTPATKCVIVPHLYGNVAPVDAIENELRGSGIAVIDDAAQSFGARCAGRRVGSFGRCGIVSTSLGKSLSGAAGGLFVTDDPELFERAVAQPLSIERPVVVARRALATWVWFRLRRFTLPLKKISDRLFSRNYTSRMRAGAMSNLDAAIALQQCGSLERRANRRRRQARRLLDTLGDAGRYCITDLSESAVPLGLVFVLPPSARTAEEAIPVLARAGIEARRGYKPLHHALGIPSEALPDAEALSHRAILVPLSRLLESDGARNALREVLMDTSSVGSVASRQ